MRAGVALLLLTVGCGPAATSSDFSATDTSGFCTTETAEGEACKREARVAEHFAGLDADAMKEFVAAMPKGGDLHSHLAGAVQTEELIDWAIEDSLCATEPDLKLVRCSSGGVPVGDIDRGKILAAWSMEGFDGTVKEGHDHFFATFGRFGLVTRNHTADMLAAVRAHAARQNEQYLELMLAFGTSRAGARATALMDENASWDAATLKSAREALIADADFKDNLADSAAEIAQITKASEAALGCGTEQADPGCDVEVRYLVQVWRASARESVFGQALYAFELAEREPRVVGLNLAAAEDNVQALATYEEAMAALGMLRGEYPARTHVALHAGELVPELLTEADRHHLTFHIREAVLTGAAERIGHGIDILGEDDSEELRAAMRERNVAVEICLSSNLFILGVSGSEHPMSAYLTSEVPVVIATDDEGVSRSGLGDEIVTAIADQKLGYRDVKAIVRRSLMASFAEGDGLLEGDPKLPSLTCDGSCDLDGDRARLQLRLEQAFARFEAEIAP
ncbi:MAG TPA: hypothetical protein VFB62_27255 [Polyangiaceae bacterium]|jgi:adenosine deaminase|nr:hypothetical protein [Polyangiaceae bacterium]